MFLYGLLLQKLKILSCGHMFCGLVILNTKLLERFKKKMQKTNHKEFRIKKVIKRKGDNLCVKWKIWDNSFNIWIDKNTYHKWVNIFQKRRKCECWRREKRPNTEFFWSALSCIRCKYRKTRTRKNSVFGHFSRSLLN